MHKFLTVMGEWNGLGYVSKVIECFCTDITYVIAKAELLDFTDKDK